jgi:GNAT superfamily N-acetyltransferase
MTGPIELRPFDPATAQRAQWDAWHALRRVLALEDEPERVPLADAASEKAMREAGPQWHSRWWLAFDGATAVGRLQVALRSGSDPSRYAGHVAVAGGVLPGRRREGIATLISRQLLAVMQEESLAIASIPVHELSRGAAFMERIGARLTYAEHDNRLLLDDVAWSAIDSHTAAVPKQLRWEIHAHRVPVARLHELAPAITRLLADIPQENSDYPVPVFEPACYEADYRHFDEVGGAHLLVMLFDGDGLAAVCDTLVDGLRPELAHQHFTGVARGWRGQGLALAVKARALQLLREHQPAVRTVLTRNAASNAPMLRVNHRLGFKLFRHSGVFQVGRDALAAALDQMPPRG